MAAAKDVLGNIGIVTTIGLVLCPAPTFLRIHRERSVLEFQSIPYVLALLQCMMWVAYAAVSQASRMSQLLIMNIVGAIIESVWCVAYVIYTKDKCRTVAQIISVVVFVVLIVLFDVLCIRPLHARPIIEGTLLYADILGLVAAVIVVLMYAAPVAVVGKVIRTKSVRYMPVQLSLMCLLNASTQAAYAIAIADWLYIVPNCLGVIVSIFQLIVYAVYCRRAEVDSQAPLQTSEEDVDEIEEMNRL